MSGVHLIDFTMPATTPALAGGNPKIRNIGDKIKLIPPKKKEAREQKLTKTPTEKQTQKIVWWKAILPLIGIIITIKLATWLARRKR